MNWFNLTKDIKIAKLCIDDICQDRSKDPHKQSTPFSLCVEQVDKLGVECNEEKDWLVLANLEFLVVVIVYFKYRGWSLDKISFATPCDIKANFARAIGVNNIVKYSYNNLKELTVSRKFDFIVGNPPYKKGLHLKFLDKAINLLNETGKLIFIHPAEWLSQLRETGRGKFYKVLREQYTPITKSIEFRNGDIEMDVGMYVPLSITFLDKEKNRNDKIFFKNNYKKYAQTEINYKEHFVNHLDDINPWDLTSKIKSITSKLDLSKNIKQQINNNPKNWYVSLSSITGNGSLSNEYYDGIIRKTQNMFNLINSTSNFVSDKPLVAKPQKGKETGNEKIWMSFNTKQEAENFLGFITKTKFFKFLTAIYKIDQHGDSILAEIPMLDFTQEWTDEKINSFYKFSDDDINLINSVMNEITL